MCDWNITGNGVANASFVIERDDYVQKVENNEVITASLVKGQYSFLDIAANLEFIRADVMVGGYCTNAVTLGLSECFGGLQNTPAPLLAAGDGWALGEGNQLKVAFSNYNSYFIWPGAYGAPGDVDSYRFSNVTNDLSMHSSGNGQTNSEYLGGYNNFDEFVIDVYGWGANYGVDDLASVLSADPFYPNKISNMVFEESSPFGSYNIRHNVKGMAQTSFNGSSGYGLESSLVVVRSFNGEFFDVNEASNVSVPMTDVSAPAVFGLMYLGAFGFAARRRKQK
jgi:hypothetical protein